MIQLSCVPTTKKIQLGYALGYAVARLYAYTNSHTK